LAFPKEISVFFIVFLKNQISWVEKYKKYGKIFADVGQIRERHAFERSPLFLKAGSCIAFAKNYNKTKDN